MTDAILPDAIIPAEPAKPKPRKQHRAKSAVEKLTPQQGKALQAYLETGSKTEAAKASGYSPEYAKHDLFNSSAMRAALQEAYMVSGLTPEHLGRVVFEATNAERIVQLPDGAGGVTVERVPDHRVRLAAVKLVAEAYLNAAAQPDDNGGQSVLPADFHTLSTDELIAVVMRRTVRR